MSSDTKKYSEIFDYLSSPDSPTEPEATVVFGRKDPLLAATLGDLVVPNLVTIAVLSGAIGKDSGNIQELGFASEADYLRSVLDEDALQRGYSLPEVVLEKEARNGAENARNSLAILRNKGLDTSKLTSVAHATSSRRLAEALKHEGKQLHNQDITVHRVPTPYNFDPNNPVDMAEARAELLRIADWPSKGWLGPQSDVPENLVDFARDNTQPN